MKILEYIGVLPATIGVLILAFGLYYVFWQPSKEKFWACFLVGSFLMSTPLLVGFNSENLQLYGGIFLISAITWIVFMFIYGAATSATSEYKTLPDFKNDTVIKESDSRIYVASWDAQKSTHVKFRYSLLMYKKEDTYISKWRGEDLYSENKLEGNFESVKEVEMYLEKLLLTPHFLLAK